MQREDTEMRSVGQSSRAEFGRCHVANTAQPESDDVGHRLDDPRSPNAPSSLPNGDGEAAARLLLVGQVHRALPSPAIIDDIRALHRMRNYAMEQRKRADLALGSFLRTQLGWRRDLPVPEGKAIKKHAAELIVTGEKEALLLAGKKLRGKPAKLDDAAYIAWRNVILASVQARGPFDDIEDDASKEMKRLAETLPAWEAFGESVRGFGPQSLAVIVGEAGDLSNYATVAKLWKRMGLAVMGEVRQGGLSKGAKKEDWIAHGYNAVRRSRMWNIGDALIKGNRDGEYRRVYLERKAYELAREPEMKPIKAHRRAQRYMEKRLLRNLWRAWREAIAMVEPCKALPPDELHRHAA